MPSMPDDFDTQIQCDEFQHDYEEIPINDDWNDHDLFNDDGEVTEVGLVLLAQLDAVGAFSS